MRDLHRRSATTRFAQNTLLVPAPRCASTVLLAIVFASSACANHGPGTSGGGSSTISGETLHEGMWDFSLRTDFTNYRSKTRAEAAAIGAVVGDFDSLDHSLVETLAAAYGVSDDVQLSASFGYYLGTNFTSAQSDGMGGATVSDADPTGLTDLWLDAKFRLMHGASGNLALVAGVKLPTGRDDVKLGNGDTLEPSSQPGSGAVDEQLGFGYSRYLAPQWTIDASAMYTLRGSHAGFTVGDRCDVGVALAWRATEDVKSFPNLSFSAELLGVWVGKDEDAGVKNENSGGTSFFVAPGVRERFNEHVSAALAFGIPLSQNLHGEQVETDWKAALTIGFAF
jgi:hypothetical protein